MPNVSYDTNVFINCPFDGQYKPIFDAITFTVHCAGFTVRSALEENNTAPERHAKITKLIRECKYGIHDISRVEINKASKLPRLNMAYECGLFYGAQLFGDAQQQAKQILVLDSEEFRYQKTMSDIAGKDAFSHENDPLVAIEKVRRFLHGKESGKLPGHQAIQTHYKAFKKDLPKIAAALSVTPAELRSLDYWPDFVGAVVEWLTAHPLRASTAATT